MQGLPARWPSRPEAPAVDDAALERELALARAVAEQVVRDRRAGAPRRGLTLGMAAAQYLVTVEHLASFVSRRSEIRAWLAALGPEKRLDDVVAGDVRLIRAVWTDAGVAPRTCNHRLAALHHLCTTLGVDSPVRGVRPLPVPRTVPVVVPVEVIEAVDARLAAAHRAGRLRTEHARARFLVAATTGRRPSEIMRAEPPDLDLAGRTWRVRDGKGGWTPGRLYLGASALAAWRLFAAVGAWGRFKEGSWVRTLRRVGGWPAGLRVYALRHSFGIAMSEAGVDLAAVGAALGHTSPDMTRTHYVPIRGSRMQAAAEAVERARPVAVIGADAGGQLPLPLLGAVDPRAGGARGGRARGARVHGGGAGAAGRVPRLIHGRAGEAAARSRSGPELGGRLSGGSLQPALAGATDTGRDRPAPEGTPGLEGGRNDG